MLILEGVSSRLKIVFSSIDVLEHQRLEYQPSRASTSRVSTFSSINVSSIDVLVGDSRSNRVFTLTQSFCALERLAQRRISSAPGRHSTSKTALRGNCSPSACA